jgi:Zn-dependent protease
MDVLQQFLRYPLADLPFIFLVLMIAFTVHEFSHAYFAYRFGDSTAKDLGRVSLNPRVHLDVVGTLLIFLAGFGWAKPVPVNRSRFKYPRLMGVVVSAAGPFSNLLTAFAGMLIIYLFSQFGWYDGMSVGVYKAVTHFLYYLIMINLTLFIFNLIPLPPLDGYRVVEDLSPRRVRARLSQYEHWAIFVFLLLVFVPPLYNVTLKPLFRLSMDIFFAMVRLCNAIFPQPVDWVSFINSL